MNRKLLQILVVPTVSIIFTSGNLVAMDDQAAMEQLSQCLADCRTKYMEDTKKKGYPTKNPQPSEDYKQCNNKCDTDYRNQR